MTKDLWKNTRKHTLEFLRHNPVGQSKLSVRRSGHGVSQALQASGGLPRAQHGAGSEEGDVGGARVPVVKREEAAVAP